MFGYPSKCHHSGTPHVCTLSLACWLVGGTSQSGCGGNPWVVACCVKKHPAKQDIYHQYSNDNGDDFQRLE